MSVEKDKKKKTEIEKRNILKEEGSSRAVVSGAYSFVFAIVGSLLLWLFTVIATDNPGLAYYGLIFAIGGIFQVLATGFSQSFIPKIKQALVEEGSESALFKASSYVKVLILLGCFMTGIMIIFFLIIQDPFTQFCLLMSIPLVILTYSTTCLGNMICVENRYDISAFIGCFFGIIVFIVGGLLIWLNVEPWLFTLIPYAIGINGFILTLIFYHRVSPFSIKDLYSKGKIKSEDSKEFIIYSSFTTLTNLETIGVLGNLIVFLATISLFIWYPSIQILAVQIITIVIVYAIVKVAIIFFAGPLNIEIAEAIAKEKHEIIQDTITDIGKIAFLIGLTLTTLVCAGAGHILRTLHTEIFLTSGGKIDEQLLIISQILLILCALGQAFYGFAALYGSALIGAGKAKYSAIGFGITLILTIVLTPIFVFLYSFIGIGIAMFITGLFILPYMLIAVKKILKVKLNCRIINHVPHLTIVFLLIFFYPLEAVLDHIAYSNNYPIGFLGLVMLLGIPLAFIIGIPFFGVVEPKDSKLIKDFGVQFKIERLSNFLIKLGRFFYYLNPLHKKPQRDKKL